MPLESCDEPDQIQPLTTCYHIFPSKGGNSIPIGYDVTIQRLAPKEQIVQTGYQGNFSVAGIRLVLHRNVAPYVAQYFLPSTLIVLVIYLCIKSEFLIANKGHSKPYEFQLHL